MRSPHSHIPALTITRSGDGWLVACWSFGCGWESFQSRRPGADRVAAVHVKAHGRKP